MLSNKILDRLLKFSDVNREDYYFNPLLFEDAAEKVSTSLCTALISTSNKGGSELKKNAQKSIVEITKKLCKGNFSNNIILTQSKYDILVKHTFIDLSNNENFSRYNRNNNQVYDMLNTYRYENLHKYAGLKGSIALCDIELGIALTNLDSDTCNKVLIKTVERCLNFNKELDKPSLEFLQKVWKNKSLILPVDLYDFLTVKLLFIFEKEVMKILSCLNEIDKPNSHIDYENKLSYLLNDSFPNFPILLNRLANSCFIFCAVFKLLSHINSVSKYNHFVEMLIFSLLKKVKSETNSNSIIHLYPIKFNPIILFLENDPNEVKSITMLYTYILELIDNLRKSSEEDFMFLITHYKKWLQHYLTYYNIQDS